MVITMKKFQFSLIIFLAAGLTISPVFAESITVSVNKDLLTQLFEKFIIQGTVDNPSPVREVIIQIFDPSGELVYSPTVPVDTSGKFLNVAKVLPSWNQDGIYRIDVIDEKFNLSTTTIIQVNLGGTRIILPYNMQVQGFEVKHNQGENLTNITVNPENKEITIFLSGQNSNELVIELPAGLITNPNTIVDNARIVDFKIITRDGKNTIVMPLTQNSNEIRIIGTSVVPEFGSLPLIMLSFALIASFVLTKKRLANSKISNF
ncbi:MAG: exported protein of unknown function [Nitrosopumilales archaeon]|nr:MAG: exported protein of unknown function [Nitrosopumilales archaeon]